MSALTLSEMMEDVRLVCAITFSSYTLIVWDYLLTLDDEMSYIWDSPSSVVKYLFIGNRYANLLVQPLYSFEVAGVIPLDSSTTCVALSWAMALFEIWSYGSVHILVLLRLWIVYGRTLKITIALTTAFILYLCTIIALIAYIISSINFNLNPASNWIPCRGKLPPFSWLVWVLEILLEAYLFGLAIFTLRQQKLSTSEFPRVSRLIHSLCRHAIIFLLANTFSDIINIIAWTVLAGTPLYEVAIALTIALVNITGQRLDIDLRRLHIQKDTTQSEVSREVAIQLAAFENSDPAVAWGCEAQGTAEIPEIRES